MKLAKTIIKWFLILLSLPVCYLLISLVLTAISVNTEEESSLKNYSVFLTTNGVHLDIIFSKTDIQPELLAGLEKSETAEYLSFGWGDENFYINTPTWAELTFSNAFSAMFLKSSTLMHVTRYDIKRTDWVHINVTKKELDKLLEYVSNSFKRNEAGGISILKGKGYSFSDDFYLANGSYSCLNTCNSWANSAFKQSGLKSCYWTPFDFGLLNKHNHQWK